MKEKITLTALIYSKLKAKKILSRKEIWSIAKDNGNAESTAERLLRNYHNRSTIPCVPLNYRKKPLEHHNQSIWYWMWAGSSK